LGQYTRPMPARRAPRTRSGWPSSLAALREANPPKPERRAPSESNAARTRGEEAHRHGVDLEDHVALPAVHRAVAAAHLDVRWLSVSLHEAHGHARSHPLRPRILPW